MKGGIVAGLVGALAVAGAGTGIFLTSQSGLTALNAEIGAVACERGGGREIASIPKIAPLDVEGADLVYRHRRYVKPAFEAVAPEGWETVVARMPVAEVDLSLGASAMTLGTCRALALSCVSRDCVTIEVTAPGRNYRLYAGRFEIYLAREADEGEVRAGLMAFIRAQRGRGAGV